MDSVLQNLFRWFEAGGIGVNIILTNFYSISLDLLEEYLVSLLELDFIIRLARRLIKYLSLEIFKKVPVVLFDFVLAIDRLVLDVLQDLALVQILDIRSHSSVLLSHGSIYVLGELVEVLVV